VKKTVVLLFFIYQVYFVYGVRPFITDDARVVGFRLFQWESWFRFDREAGQYWHMFAYGVHKKIELTAGGVFGYFNSEPEKINFTYALPLIQGKFLFTEYGYKKPPGVGIVCGSFLPGGKGAFVQNDYGAFAFATVTQCIGKKENLLIHANIGFNYLYNNARNVFVPIWGVGAQVRTLGGMHLVMEYFSGDPYVPGSGAAYQAGIRHFFSDDLQIDATLGEGLKGAHPMPFWFSLGLRWVFHTFEKK
jgi:hypothetical protein